MSTVIPSLGDRVIRGALLGTGSIAVHHMRAWQAIPNVEIVALANRTRDKAVAMGREFGIEEAHIYSDYGELLKQETVDFVDIATAPHVHREQVLAAAKAGIHVFCQKPFATSTAEAMEMIETCEQAGVRCIVNENWRWRRWYRALRQMLDEGVIGKPHYARCEYRKGDVMPGADALLIRQPYTAQMPHLIIYEQGVHFIDVMRFLFGDISRIYAHTNRVSPLVAGEDEAIVMLEFGDNLIGLIDMSWSTFAPQEKRTIRGNLDYFIIEGDAGSIELNPYQGDMIIITTANGTSRRPAHPDMTPAEAYQESYFNTQSHFIHCLRTGQPAENDARDNLKTFAAAMIAYESAVKREWMAVDRGN